MVEKSRDAGATVLCLAWALHRFIFFKGTKLTFGSRKEMLVDRLGDPDSLFEKLRQMLKSTPEWMRPRYTDNYQKIINLDNGSSITGEAGVNIGRGGRSGAVFIDEAAHIERPLQVEAAISQNSDVKIYISTPCGTGNLFAQKRFSGDIDVFTFHWTQDPRKTQEWYEKQVKSLDPITVAQEIDLDYSASLEGVYIEAPQVESTVELPIPVGGKVVAGYDVAAGGKNSNVLVVRRGDVILPPISWRNLDVTQSAYKVVELCKQYRVSQLSFDATGVGAGTAGTLNSITELPFKFLAVNSSGKPSSRWWPSERKYSHEKFLNVRAELWGLVRERIYNTYDRQKGYKDWDLSDCISLPNDRTLIAQLSQVLVKTTSTGKLQMESKEDMKKRGVSSPDFADALTYSYYEEPCYTIKKPVRFSR